MGNQRFRASLDVMRDYAGIAPFRRGLDAFDFDKLNEQIADEFVSALATQVQEDIAAGKPNLRTRFDELRGIFCRSNSIVPRETRPSCGHGGSAS